jgi:hypothetical protein
LDDLDDLGLDELDDASDDDDDNSDDLGEAAMRRSSGSGEEEGDDKEQQQAQAQAKQLSRRGSTLLELVQVEVERAQRCSTASSSAVDGTNEPSESKRERRRQRRQQAVFQRALLEVPKSGEVWCEGARIALARRDFETARKYLDFAIQFTPQYGDSFIEFMRLELLEHGAHADTSSVEQACVNADPNYGALWLHCKRHPLDSTRQVLRVARYLLIRELYPEHALAMYENDVQLCSVCGCQDLPPDPDCYTFLELSVNTIYQDIHARSNEERRKAIFL